MELEGQYSNERHDFVHWVDLSHTRTVCAYSLFIHSNFFHRDYFQTKLWRN